VLRHQVGNGLRDCGGRPNRISKAAQEGSFEALEPSFVRLGFHQARLQFDC
jgi:hypothetical protein